MALFFMCSFIKTPVETIPTKLKKINKYDFVGETKRSSVRFVECVFKEVRFLYFSTVYVNF